MEFMPREELKESLIVDMVYQKRSSRKLSSKMIPTIIEVNDER